MSAITSLAREFLVLANEELIESGLESTIPNQNQVLTDWVEVYEDVPPRNRAEIAVRDALIEARDRVRACMHRQSQNA